MSHLNKLRWRCRRGTLELDLMLLRYLDRCYADAGTVEQNAFETLLTLEDSELIGYLLDGRQLDRHQKLHAVVQRIRALPIESDWIESVPFRILG